MRRSTFTPSWRGVQLVSLLSVLLCLFLVLYTARTTPWSVDSVKSHVEANWAWGWKWKGKGEDAHEHVPEKGEGVKNVPSDSSDSETNHPITTLLQTASSHFTTLLSSDPSTLSEAARAYRATRHRHPPPHFDAWFAFAKARHALIPETFFDRIYADLGPFWGVPVDELRRNVRGFRGKISVRGGVVVGGVKTGDERVEMVVGLLEELGRQGVEMPDVDLAVAGEGERMFVPWGVMETAIEFANAFMPKVEDVVGGFEALGDKEVDGGGDDGDKFDPEWQGDGMRHKPGGPFLGPTPLWSLVKPACSPGSETAREEVMADIWHPQGHTKIEHSAAALLPLEVPTNATEGYVANWTVATDVCKRPELQGLNGGFVAPKFMSVTQKLFPLFSNSKISASNEILIPSFASLNTSTSAIFAHVPWKDKEAKLYWRGPASGGANSELNWRRIHRHRFVSMLNATHVEIAEALLHAGNESTVGLGYASNFRLLPANAYHLATQKGARMAEWVSGWADASFTGLQCDQPSQNGTCSYTDEFFSVQEAEDVSQEKYKYVAVLDGDGGEDGGELLQRMIEGRVVLRSSVYTQWHDSRLIPWLHFVPLDHTLIDLYGVMEYFLGSTVSSSAPAFAHAHVEVEKHEHHFQTPHWDEDVEEPSNDVSGHEGHSRRSFGQEDQSLHDGGDGHDAQAQRIAEAGQQWAREVLRREDALVYTYRLLLEYARVVSPKRHTMGWVDDLSAG